MYISNPFQILGKSDPPEQSTHQEESAAKPVTPVPAQPTLPTLPTEETEKKKEGFWGHVGGVFKHIAPVAEDVAKVAIPIAETVFPVARIPLEVAGEVLQSESKSKPATQPQGEDMNFETLGIMLAISALNTFVKNPKTNAAVNAQIATAATDVLESMGYTVTAPPTPTSN